MISKVFHINLIISTSFIKKYEIYKFTQVPAVEFLMSFWWMFRDFLVFYYVSSYISVEILMNFWGHLGKSVLGLEFVEINEFLQKSFEILSNCWNCWLLLSFCDFCWVSVGFLLNWFWNYLEFLMSFWWAFWWFLIVLLCVKVYIWWVSDEFLMSFWWFVVRFLLNFCWVYLTCWISVGFLLSFVGFLLTFCWSMLKYFFGSPHWNYEM